MLNKKYIALALGILFVAIVSGWFVTRYYLSPAVKSEKPLVELRDGAAKNTETMVESSSNIVSVKIFHPSGGAMVVTERKVQNKQLPVEMAETVMTEFLNVYQEAGKNAKVLGVYKDRRNILYVDMSDTFKRSFSGDVRQEFLLVKSLYDTVVSNVSGIEDVRLLIEGKEIESIGGHFYSLYGLKETATEKPGTP